jgi:fumarate reductase flavoprotein subunit/urocanate reductase
MEKAKQGLSRRDFLVTGAAASAVLLATGALAGCTGVSETAVKWDGEYDVVVVGGGGAGISAAYEAAKAGAKTLVIEYEANHLASNTALCGGVVMAAESNVQKRAGVTDSKAEWRKYVTAVGGGYDDAAKMDIWVEKAADTLNWLEEIGVVFPEKLLYMSGNETDYAAVTKPVPRGAVTDKQSGAPIAEALYKVAKAAGVETKFETTAERLVTSSSGRVVGVKTNNGSFKAKKAVVITSAGFTRNIEWIRSFKPDLATGGSFGSSRQKGDGIRMGMALGAKLGNMWITQADTIGTKMSETMWPCMVIAIWKLPCIFVSSDGKRHMPEDMYYEYQCHEIAKQKDGFVWSIWDQTITGMGGQVICVPALSKGCENEIKAGYVKKANTIEELAKLIEVDPATLKATVDNYNAMMRAGVDTEWGRKTGLGEVIKAPFYAAKTVPAACDTAGGLCTDTNCKVLSVWDQPIPGLYAAGSNTSGWRGKVYQGSGAAVSTAITFGRIAGRNAAAEATQA